MADENGYNYALTVHFSDEDSIIEYCVQEVSIDKMKGSWYRTQEADALLGVHYEITGFDVEEL
jgi:hypothetical protein